MYVSATTSVASVNTPSKGIDAEDRIKEIDEGDQKNEIKTDNSNRYNGDIYEQVKTLSIQLSNLANTVESLQSQVKQLQETIRLLKQNTIRKRITSNDGTKNKKKTKRRGNARSRKK